MAGITGIEVTADSCVLVRVRRAFRLAPGTAHRALQASAAHIADLPQSPDHALAALQEMRHQHRFPRRARVVGWGLHESATPSDPATKTFLRPILDAGFRVEAVFTPPQAGQKPAPAQPLAPGPASAAVVEAELRTQSAPSDEKIAPTSRPRAVPLKDPLPVVNSILISSDRRLAIVDGRIAQEGDQVGRRVLLRVEPSAIVLREPSGHEVRVPPGPRQIPVRRSRDNAPGVYSLAALFRGLIV